MTFVARQQLDLSLRRGYEALAKRFNRASGGSSFMNRSLVFLTPISALDSPSWWLHPLKVQARVDITGLIRRGVYVPSDITTSNRGPAFVGRRWRQEYNHPIPKPGEKPSPDNFLYTTYETVRMLMAGAPFISTPEYQAFQQQLAAGKNPYGLSSESELPERGNRLSGLISSLENHGYKRDSDTPLWDEVHLYVDASGEILVGRHANHRLAIARAIGLEKMPARIGGIHVQFIRKYCREEKLSVVVARHLQESGVAIPRD